MTIHMAGPWITEHEEKIVLDALRNGWYGDRAYWYVETFEREFAAWHGRTHALMTPNCTTAIHLLLAGLDIGEGYEVIVPECTWIATAAPITYQRATTVFADIDPIHWCLTPQSIEARISPRTKAVIVVDLFGNMPDWDGICAVSERHGITVIEDSAEALGSTYKGMRAGKFGVGSVFSFHRTKTLTTGEGGMLLLDDKALFERCKFLRDHGRAPGTYFNTEVTFKYMPFNLQAALGYAQFQRIDELVERKRWIFRQFAERLADIPDLLLNPEPAEVRNGYWTTALVFGHSHGLTKEKAMGRLEAMGLPVRPFFYPLSALPAYPEHNESGRQANPVSYDVSARGINVPCALSLTEEQIDTYCGGLRRLLGRA
ncbi:MAG: DegT/DnrJ/EryC1/StrS family aminotransferase [Kiloniellales bacterium]